MTTTVYLSLITDLEVRATALLVWLALLIFGWLAKRNMADMLLLATLIGLAVLAWGRFLQWGQRR